MFQLTPVTRRKRTVVHRKPVTTTIPHSKCIKLCVSDSFACDGRTTLAETVVEKDRELEVRSRDVDFLLTSLCKQTCLKQVLMQQSAKVQEELDNTNAVSLHRGSVSSDVEVLLLI